LQVTNYNKKLLHNYNLKTKNKTNGRKVKKITVLVMPFASSLSFLKKKYVDGLVTAKELQKQ
jgi:hypothetical protein